MQTKIQQVNPAEYELEITSTAEDLAPEIDKALRAQRTRTTLKGFRPGKAPLPLLKKMYGQALAYEIAEKKVQSTYEEEVLNSEEYKVLGQPKLTTLEYEEAKGLHAVVRFGVRPEIELKDLSGEKVTRLVHEVTDEEVDEEVERLRKKGADLIPLQEEIGDKDYVLVDMQHLDSNSGAPIIGKKEEGVAFFLDDPRLKEELREALLGRKEGDVFRVELLHEHAHEEELHSDLLELPGQRQEEHPHGTHTHAYQVTIREAKRRELPELDAEFIKEITQDAQEDEAGLRQEIRGQLERAWKQNTRDFFSENVVDRMRDLHPIPVPDSVVDIYLDSFVQDVRERNKGKLPESFDEEAFRDENREEARKQAHWMLLRDKIIEQEGLEVTEEERDKHLEETAAGGGLEPEMLRRFYKAVPAMQEQLDARILSDKVFDWLAGQFEVVDKDQEALMQELEARSASPIASPEE